MKLLGILLAMLIMASCNSNDGRVYTISVEYVDGGKDTLLVNVPGIQKPKLNEHGCLDVYYWGTVVCQVKKVRVLHDAPSDTRVFSYRELETVYE